MGVITTGSWGKALFATADLWFGKDYPELTTEHTMLFDMRTSNRAFEEHISMSGFGLGSAKTQGNGISYDTQQQGFITRYEMITYGLGFIVTREAMEDDEANVIVPDRARELRFSMNQTEETIAANVYNNGFDSSFTGGDGKEMLATDHPNVAGGTYANELSTAADMSEASLEQAVIDIMKLDNDRGLQIALMPKSLHIPPDLVFEAERILKSPFRVGTSDNDVNALNSLGKFPGGVHVNHYFTDADAWFIRTNIPGMWNYNRRPLEFSQDNEFDTENAKFKATQRYAYGWSDPRSIFGSPGA